MLQKVTFFQVLLLTLGIIFTATSSTAAQPSISIERVNSSEVGMYEKFEIILQVEATYSNPFDPDEIDLHAVFTSPSGMKWDINGYFSSSMWKVRFSPDETGKWNYRLQVTDSEGTTESDTETFTVVPSDHHGWIKVSPHNNRYLMHDDGSSFYGVGMWYNDSYWDYNRFNITEEGLDELKAHGANTLCFFPTPLESLAYGVGRYDQDRCGRLDDIFEWCESREMYVLYNMWFHSFLSETVWGGEANIMWHFNAYKNICKCVDFYRDETAWKYQEKLYRYMIARWGYSRSLAVWFVIDEITGTDGWEHGDTAVAEQWCSKVHNYFKEHDPYGRPTTGSQHGGVTRYWPNGYKIFDIAGREIYELQGFPVGDDPLRSSYMNYTGEIQKLWNDFTKPALIVETGGMLVFYQIGTPEYLATYHNAIWVSLTSGLAMTPLWWSFSREGSIAKDNFPIKANMSDYIVTDHLLHFSNFISDIDFANLELNPAEITAEGCDAYAMKSDEIIFGWIVSPRSGITNTSFMISGLSDGSYEVEYYRTWRGRTMGKHLVNCSGGKLTDTIPVFQYYSNREYQAENDIAFKILPK